MSATYTTYTTFTAARPYPTADHHRTEMGEAVNVVHIVTGSAGGGGPDVPGAPGTGPRLAP